VEVKEILLADAMGIATLDWSWLSFVFLLWAFALFCIKKKKLLIVYMKQFGSILKC
jgi:hypothetical protein